MEYPICGCLTYDDWLLYGLTFVVDEGVTQTIEALETMERLLANESPEEIFNIDYILQSVGVAPEFHAKVRIAWAQRKKEQNAQEE